MRALSAHLVRILSSTDGTTYQKQLSLHRASRVPVQPSVQPRVPAPQMNFSGCNVTIYIGPGPCLPQPQSSVPPPLPALPQSNMLDLTDAEFNEFWSD